MYSASSPIPQPARPGLSQVVESVNAPRRRQPAVGTTSYSRDIRPGGAQIRQPIQPRRQGAHPFLTGLSRVISPIVGVDINSNFGPRTHPITGRHSDHTGIDLDGELGTPILAPANAVLAAMRPGTSIYGNQLILGHGRNQETMYGHLSRFAEGLKPGSKIRRGDVIGYVGSTGLSSGPHLHWETWQGGNPVNPMQFLGGS